MDTMIRGMRNVLRNPLRLLLIVCLLGASLMLVAAMVSLNGSAQQELTNVHQQVGTAITISYAVNDSQSAGQHHTGSNPPARTLIPNSAVATVKRVSGVTSVEESLSRIDTDGTLKASSVQAPNGRAFSLPPAVYGISTGAAHFTLEGGATPTLESGRSFQASDANSFVAMMSETLARANNLIVGSTFSLKGKTFTIIGLYTTGQTFADSSLVVPLATMQSVFGVNGVDSITAYAQSYEQVDTVVARLRTVLGRAYDVVTEASDYTNTIDALIAVQNSSTLALIIAILTATLVIIFTVLITVRERTIEIGILKAIGASHWQVIRQFWGEVLALSFVAGLVAVSMLATLGPVISQAFSVSPNATPGGFGGGVALPSSATANLNVHLSAVTLNAEALLLIVGLGMGLAVLTSVIPAWYVARIKPAEVLRRG